jgi:hypothetical protein
MAFSLPSAPRGDQCPDGAQGRGDEELNAYCSRTLPSVHLSHTDPNSLGNQQTHTATTNLDTAQTQPNGVHFCVLHSSREPYSHRKTNLPTQIWANTTSLSQFVFYCRFYFENENFYCETSLIADTYSPGNQQTATTDLIEATLLVPVNYYHIMYFSVIQRWLLF